MASNLTITRKLTLAFGVAGKLGEIVQGVTKVTDIVAEIASAAKEQATGIAQVNKAVVEMDKVTQQNAASAEEASSAASELSGQSEELASMVATFRLEEESSTTGPRRTARPAQSSAGPGAIHPASKRRSTVASHRGSGGALESTFPMEDDKVREF